MSERYYYQRGVSFPVAADVVGPELKRIEESEGPLKPERVLEIASDPESPIHPCFTWDDAAAAQQHRLNEARRLIRSVQVYIQGPRKPMRVPCYINVKTPEHGRVYLPAEKVVEDQELINQIREHLTTVIENYERKYHHISQVFDLLQEIKATVGAS